MSEHGIYACLNTNVDAVLVSCPLLVGHNTTVVYATV